METPDKTRKRLLRTLHYLMRELGIDDNGRAGLLDAYGVLSAADLRVGQLMDLVDRLTAERTRRGQTEGNSQPTANPQRERMNLARRRAIAACGQMLARQGYLPHGGWTAADMDMIKRVCCRAAKCENFNEIELAKLASSFNAK